jgi:flagellar biosynthesis regulator FlaF
MMFGFVVTSRVEIARKSVELQNFRQHGTLRAAVRKRSRTRARIVARCSVSASTLLSYVAEELGISRDTLRRESRANGISTAGTRPRRMTLFANEIEAVVAMRKQGRTFSYIAEEIGICEQVLRRELRANGISTAPLSKKWHITHMRQGCLALLR